MLSVQLCNNENLRKRDERTQRPIEDKRVFRFGGLRFNQLIGKDYAVAHRAKKPVRLAGIFGCEIVDTSRQGAGESA
jgi:hypothetical protein